MFAPLKPSRLVPSVRAGYDSRMPIRDDIADIPTAARIRVVVERMEHARTLGEAIEEKDETQWNAWCDLIEDEADTLLSSFPRNGKKRDGNAEQKKCVYALYVAAKALGIAPASIDELLACVCGAEPLRRNPVNDGTKALWVFAVGREAKNPPNPDDPEISDEALGTLAKAVHAHAVEKRTRNDSQTAEALRETIRDWREKPEYRAAIRQERKRLLEEEHKAALSLLLMPGERWRWLAERYEEKYLKDFKAKKSEEAKKARNAELRCVVADALETACFVPEENPPRN